MPRIGLSRLPSPRRFILLSAKARLSCLRSAYGGESFQGVLYMYGVRRNHPVQCRQCLQAPACCDCLLRNYVSPYCDGCPLCRFEGRTTTTATTSSRSAIRPSGNYLMGSLLAAAEVLDGPASTTITTTTTTTTSTSLCPRPCLIRR